MFLKFSLLLCFSLLISCGEVKQSQHPRVEAAGESLEGELLDGGIAVFRGVPFAAPPIGDLRWRPPSPHQPREGIQQAKEFGDACPQRPSDIPEWYRGVAEGHGLGDKYIAHKSDISEDCLYLNIWSSGLEAKADAPVYVWIHGGAHRNDYAHYPNYHGHNMARQGLVFVSIEFRSGTFGYLAHPELSAESDRGVSGNYGFLDQIAALEWIQKNISAFGGDPDNVTIAGQSFGADDVGFLTTSPLSEGLFKRAVMQSTNFFKFGLPTLDDAEVLGKEYIDQFDLESDKNLLDEMRQIPWQDLVEAPYATYLTARTPVLDGWAITAQSYDILNPSEQHKVDLLIGMVENEWYMYWPDGVTEEKYWSDIKWLGGRLAEEIEASLPTNLSDNSLKGRLDKFRNLSEYECHARYIAQQTLPNSPNVYLYKYTRVRPGGENTVKAYHSAEIPFSFNTQDEWWPENDIDSKLTDILHGYWTNFAKTGNPNATGLPHWPAFSQDGGSYQELGDRVQPQQNMGDGLCALFDQLIGEIPAENPN